MNKKQIQKPADQPNRRLWLKNWRSNRWIKGIALYATMVCVSTCAIFFLEHATLVHAIRTALVAAVGKSVAASWIVQLFD